MTVAPASTLEKRINSASLDWSYMRSSSRLDIRRAYDLQGSDTRFIRRGRRRKPPRPALHWRECFPSSSPRQRLHVNVRPDVRQLAVPEGRSKNEMVLGSCSQAF
jgi:hypothetical protein